jgi:hypothetical protein
MKTVISSVYINLEFFNNTNKRERADLDFLKLFTNDKKSEKIVI